MRLLILLLALGLPALAQAQRAPSVDLGILSGCSAVAIDAAVNCEVRAPAKGVQNTRGFTSLTLEIFYDDNAGGASTGYTLFLESCNEGTGAADCTDSTDWHRVQALDIATTGVATMVDLQLLKASDADARSVVTIGINYLRTRVAGLVGSGSPGATDKATVAARLAVAAVQ